VPAKPPTVTDRVKQTLLGYSPIKVKSIDTKSNTATISVGGHDIIVGGKVGKSGASVTLGVHFDCADETCTMSCDQQANVAGLRAVAKPMTECDNTSLMPSPDKDVCNSVKNDTDMTAEQIARLNEMMCERITELSNPDPTTGVRSCKPKPTLAPKKLVVGCGDPTSMCAPDMKNSGGKIILPGLGLNVPSIPVIPRR
jgi:hypothetical protein